MSAPHVNLCRTPKLPIRPLHAPCTTRSYSGSPEVDHQAAVFAASARVAAWNPDGQRHPTQWACRKGLRRWRLFTRFTLPSRGAASSVLWCLPNSAGAYRIVSWWINRGPVARRCCRWLRTAARRVLPQL